ncbi:sugar phosphate permease [Paraburkholderia bannensis]|uniref:Sugar phosphate permease n=2 Tax=Burkholderiaceae TaxID=119060 RepID=A0A7W9U1B4_9BURK|nr:MULTISPECIES: MFS transporter [Paraburkholderia]MBB3259450.1 sugar phosphate permease [Paraburkholderia sp. WP4_3_2]MBB6104466.1 sugar phosphate permease [Paraburkholderia bannensis]
MNPSRPAYAATHADTHVDESQSSLYTKVAWRLVPLLFFCYVAAYLDRVNVGFAKLQMLKDLHFSETVYGLGAGIFFIGYFLFEVPSNIILHKVGARLWIARVMLTWAVISGCMMFVRTPTMFYTLRFLLGLAEAGLFPGVILYLTYWFPSERRGKIIALFMTGIPISGVLGGPLSGWILHSMSGAKGLAGWQWLFLLEAIPSLVLGVVVILKLDKGIEQAKWLSDAEKRTLSANIATDASATTSHTFKDGFTRPMVWVLSAIYLFFIMGLYGVGFWLPTLIKGSGVKDPLTIGMLTTLPYAAAAISMILVGRSSDARRERRWHVAVPGVIGTVGWVVAVVAGSGNVTLAMIGLTIATMGVMTTLCQFWCLPTAILAGAAAATGVAVVNSVGNLAGFVSPYVIGWIIDRTHSTDLGVYTLAACLTMGALLVLALPKQLVNR